MLTNQNYCKLKHSIRSHKYFSFSSFFACFLSTWSIFKFICIWPITTFLRKPRHVSKSFIMDFPIGCHVESISMFIDSPFLLWKCISKRTKYSYYYAHQISHLKCWKGNLKASKITLFHLIWIHIESWNMHYWLL